jgi:hypothetical protein
MAIETSLQPRQKWWNVLYAFICFVLAAWGAYDYWVTIPRKEEAVAAYDAAAKAVETVEAKVTASGTAPGASGAVTPEEVAAYEAAKKIVEKGRPTPPAAYDRPVQLWLYMMGCGVMGVPYFLAMWLGSAGKKYRLEDDGTLMAPEGRFAASDIQDIDMSRWMSKSIATVTVSGGKKVVLDDYKFRNVHLIVGKLAHARYPEEWTDDARDMKKIRAEAEAAAAAQSTPADPAAGGSGPNAAG